MVKFYWHKFDSLKVTMHLQRDMTFRWYSIKGVGIGNYFIGVINGEEDDK